MAWIPRLQAEEALRHLSLQQAQFISDPREFRQFVAALERQARGPALDGDAAHAGGLRTMREFAAFINQYAGGAALAVPAE